MGTMKLVKNKLIGLIEAINRYPLAMLFLLAAAMTNAYMINHTTDSLLNYFYTFLIGAFLSIISQHMFERFFTKASERLLLKIGAVLISLGYYFLMDSNETLILEGSVETGIITFALAMVFVWIPSIKDSVTFSGTFMAAFKSFFTALLFALVIAIGLSAILLAVDVLLFSIDFKVYSHIWNIVFILFAPIFFLSLTPLYPGKISSASIEQTRTIEEATKCPKTLDVLVSYIIIPLTGIYTIILLVYILINIGGRFWEDNLLEPMLVTYAVTVILVYILASSLTNQFAVVFRKVFPKVLIPIVFFQTIASILKIGDVGLTYNRYYVIMFGVFAIISSVLFSFFPIRKHGWIVAVLFILSAVSVIPPTDAFSVSRVSQISNLKETLTHNDMFEDHKIQPNNDISKKDKITITKNVDYLENQGYISDLEWLPDNIYNQDEFENTFGFTETYEEASSGTDYGPSTYLDWEQGAPVDIEGYDLMLYVNTDNYGKSASFKINGDEYQLKLESGSNDMNLALEGKNDELLQFDLIKAFDKILESGDEEQDLDIEKATVTEESDAARMTIITNSVEYYDSSYTGDLYVFIEMK